MEHHSQDYVDWMNDPDMICYMESGGDYTGEKLRKFLKEVEEKEILFLAIHLKENGMHLGKIKMDPINEKDGRVEYGIMMGRKSEWGKGYAREASNTIIDYCFEELGIRKITLGVVAVNEAALHLYRSMGFSEEGVYKKHSLYEGKYSNIVRMALFNPDFKYE
ncbi:GNAT family N-acetyltransferase [Balneolaceae bacterium YR4-1]|uniref:GNAT family N-acetyltransferase n=1 Tax=Halalkalibaculum roseum TaxID=2709311 RepID=A0A6M1T8B8_9BACT|nr:GNAT family N-acetyltransferase [Halalkalibaculum roseum]